MDPGLRRGDGFMSYCDKLLFIFVVALDEIFGYNSFVITDGCNGVWKPVQYAFGNEIRRADGVFFRVKTK